MRSTPRSIRIRRRRSAESGQSLVEFALVLTPLFLILLGIVQFGFIFNAYITITNATREAGREASIYVYDRTLSAGQNDAARNAEIRETFQESLNLLSPNAPYFSTTGTWTQSGDTFTNGDLTVTYELPDDVSDSDPRTGQTVTIQARYHQDLLIPFISALLPRDGNGRMVLTGEVTMVIN
ncbi:MAG TPA: TadE/TadG family type IV pilus assembly protein [Candidatus Limnocylindrales bacterium]|nr:TadE/TadG family type IV pilus assembly protein [Candidatus Limnocylindrales bacterium]